VSALGLGEREIEPIEREERAELERRERRYRGGRPPLDVAGKQVVIVDDGVATGSTMQAALEALRLGGPGALVVATPAAAPRARDRLAAHADAVVCVATPDPFRAVGAWYRRFDQTSDDEVHDLLAASRRSTGATNGPVS
jgi:putative phosphoribosyl transferase